MMREPGGARRPLLLALGHASPELVARVRGALLAGWYRPAGPDGWPGLRKPECLRILGARRLAMRASEMLGRSPLTAWAAIPASSIPTTSDDRPEMRYAHISWKPGIHAYPDDADSLALARIVMSAPTIDADQTERLVSLMEDLTGLALDEPALKGPGSGRSIGCTLGTPWSPPLAVSTDVEHWDVDGNRDRNIPFASTPLDPDITDLLPNVIKAEEWCGGPGTRIMLTPITVLSDRSSAARPIEGLRALDALRRDPIEDHAVPA